jgi:hypothetical protein
MEPAGSYVAVRHQDAAALASALGRIAGEARSFKSPRSFSPHPDSKAFQPAGTLMSKIT